MLNLQNKKGFSLAEMMVVMLMLSIIFAAAAPILTKKATQTAEVKASGGSGVPVGTIIIWASSTLPQGDEAGKWLECNGQSTASYPELKAVLGDTVPDYRGVFIRGHDNNKGYDNYRTLGSYQSDTFKAHNHNRFTEPVSGRTFVGAYLDIATIQRYVINSNTTTATLGNLGYYIQLLLNDSLVNVGGTETRPKNVAAKYLIKAKS